MAQGLGEGKNALVVDDYKSMRQAVTDMLGRMGFAVKEAVDGLDALEILKGYHPNLIVSDLVMPRMDGFELTYEVKNTKDTVNIPVIVVSTHTDSNHILKAIKNGADDYVTKPIDENYFRKVVERVLDQD